jgi:hypothetical protein
MSMGNLIVYRPIKSNFVTQKFGENSACIKVSPNGVPLSPPKIKGAKNEICPVGYIPFYKSVGMYGHNGVDMKTWNGEPLYFPTFAEGGVKWFAKLEADSSGGFGVDVISDTKIPLKDGDFDICEFIKFRFWHMKEVAVSNGEEVKLGQYLGKCDNTGASSSSHLHWSMKPCKENGEPIYRQNGYKGAVDFSKWADLGIFVLEVCDAEEKPLSACDTVKKAISNLQGNIKK